MLELFKKLLATKEEKSGKFQLDLSGVKNLGRDSVIIGLIAGLVYFGGHVVGVDFDGPDVDTGMSAIIGGGLALVADAVVRWLKDNKKVEDK